MYVRFESEVSKAPNTRARSLLLRLVLFDEPPPDTLPKARIIYIHKEYGENSEVKGVHSSTWAFGIGCFLTLIALAVLFVEIAFKGN